MSQEVFELVQGMDLKSIETQIALQCAPLICEDPEFLSFGCFEPERR